MRKSLKPMATLSAKGQELRARGLLNSKHELLLYGMIGSWWEGMDALTIVRELEAIDTDVITVRIHSPGGYITEGLAMYNALRSAKKPVHVYIDGICASMATVVAMAAAKGHLYTPDNALWMIHKPWGGTEGNATQLREYADTLDVLEQSMISAYTATGRLTEERIREILATGKDHYFTGAEAVAEGIADVQTQPVKAAASVDLSSLHKPAGQHQSLYEFYAVNAAITPQSNQEEMCMKLQQLLALMAALTVQGVEATDINAALAKALRVEADKVAALLDPNAANKATETQLQAAHDALAALRPTQQPQPPAAAGAQDTQAAIAAERRRVADINALVAKHSLAADFAAMHVNSGSSLEVARAAALDILAARDQGRQPAPGVRVIVSDEKQAEFRGAIANAMLNRMQPSQFKLDEAGRDFRGQSLLGLAAACLERVGVPTRGLTPNELAAKALHTTSDFPEIVSDVANKVLLRAYQAQPRTFLPIANQVSLRDFKLKHAIEIGGGSELKEVGEAGEFEYGTVTEGKRSYKLSTFGRIFSLSRQLLINDDIGAFNQFLSNVGALAARKESSVIWDLVKAGAIFSSGNKNLVSSGGTVDETQLDKARMLLRKQTGLDGEPINIAGKYLVVNSDRETVAQKMLSAVQPTATSGVNVFANSLQLIVEPLLDGVANNPWYMFADPMLVPTLEYAYLEGESGPYIETKYGFEVDGIQIKMRHDFGGGWVSHRGAVKNPGA